VRDAVRSLWSEPRAPDPPARTWFDGALVATLVVVAVVESLLRADATRPVALVVCVVPAFGLLWRRAHPLAVTVAVFSVAMGVDAVAGAVTGESMALYTTAYVLLLPYALLRWGSGREAGIGLAFVMGTCALSSWISAGVTDALTTIPFLLLPAALGASVRYRASSRVRAIDEVKLRERELLARELHDTVAHHVSAISIRAQAGRAVAATDPAGALDALEVIEREASRTLAEMRMMVGALRQGDEAELAPQRRAADVARLAGRSGDGPEVVVDLSGDLDGLSASVGAAIYRLAQESITNAVRHARHATRVTVRVAVEDERVHLTVRDDGEAVAVSVSSPGYGLVGMTERVTLLGGTLEAGPTPERGWTVDAVLPRTGAST